MRKDIGHWTFLRSATPAVLAALLAVLGCEPVANPDLEEDIGFAEAGLSRCAGGSLGAADYCTPTCLCDAGQGDCDSDAECSAGNICGVNNGARYGFSFQLDFCAPPHCFDGTVSGDETGVDCGGPSCGMCVCETGEVGAGSYCTVSCPCEQGEGDCDSDAECAAGLACVNDVGASYGQDPTNDVCVAASCSDGVLNGTETGLDCGGSCAPCAGTNPELASLDSSENPANGRSELFYGTSGDGRYVVFGSAATNLVGGDTNGVADVFVRDRIAGTTTRVSVASAGAQGNGASYFASVSADGRYVAFVSDATNLVSGDSNGFADVFVRDVVGGSTRRVNVGPGGAQANAAATYAQIAGGGRYITYTSTASNLVAGDTNAVADVFVADRITLSSIRASVGPGGVQGDGASERSTISSDGAVIAFQSLATNFATADANATFDVFVRNRFAGTTVLVSVDTTGGVGDSGSIFPVVAAGGGFVAFRSNSSDLVVGDTNGRYDIFVRALGALTTERVSVDSAGVQANGPSVETWISGDGSRVAFASAATNLGGDLNGTVADIYLRDRVAATTTVVASGNGQSQQPVLSANGLVVIYRSDASNVVAGDTNGQADIVAQPL